MMWWFMIVLAVFMKMSEAGVPLPRKVVLNGDNLEILRLDIMSAEVRVSNNVKEMADRVEDALALVMGRNLMRLGRTSTGPTLLRPRRLTARRPGWT